MEKHSLLSQPKQLKKTILGLNLPFSHLTLTDIFWIDPHEESHLTSSDSLVGESEYFLRQVRDKTQKKASICSFTQLNGAPTR